MKRKRPGAGRTRAGDKNPASRAAGQIAGADIDALIDAAIGDHPRLPANDLSDHASPLSLGLHDAGATTTTPEQSAPSSTTRRMRKSALPASGGPGPATFEKAGPVSSAPAIVPEPNARMAPGAELAPSPVAERPRNSSRTPKSAPAARTAKVAKPQQERLEAANPKHDNAPPPAGAAVASPSLAEVGNAPAAALAERAVPSMRATTGERLDERPETRAPQPASPFSEAERPAVAPTAPTPAAAELGFPDIDMAATTMGRLIEYSGKVAAAYLHPRESGGVKPSGGEDLGETFKTIGRVAESWLSNPARMIQAQAALSAQIFGVWSDTLSRFSGATPTDADVVPARKADRRFNAPEWRETPMFDFLHQAYLATTDWATAMVKDAQGIDEATREKASFYLRQISSAMSPANFLATNPELIKETFRENGENLVRGMKMLAEDIEAGGGDLKIRQSDSSKFKLGIDMAATPGKVVFRNDLMELLQYSPSTPEVLKRPLLIVPPWINKFYVLDLNTEKSFIGWAVSQGVTVFVISWVNPDHRHAGKDWDAYMREGIFAALDAIEQATGEADVSTVGYCVGGTLLAATLAHMAGKGDARVSSSTFLTTQVDFEEAGDLKVFADEAQIRALEKEMTAGGYLPGSKMANAFNMLRPDDLIWSYAVNTYLKGKAPAAFDLLAWNADSTRMTAANHAFYLRNCYLENNLAKGEMVIGGEKLNLGAITIPIYDLAAKEDHIAPARSVFKGARYFGGPVRYVVAGSGHIAGVVNPPSKAKYQYWADGVMTEGFEAWFQSARETKGTWWVDWIAWLKAQSATSVPARIPGEGGLPALCDAPGDYVREPS